MNKTVKWHRFASPLEAMLVIASDEGILGLHFAGERYQPVLDDEWTHAPGDPLLRRAQVEVDEYFGGARREYLVIEYAALGVLSALTGVVLAVAGNAALAKFVFEASPWPDFTVVAGAFAAATGISVIGGLALSRGVCHHPPLEILRSGV